MRIVTRITLGYGLLVLLMVGALAYQVVLIREILQINRELSHIDVEAARISIRLLRALDPVEEFATKYFILGDDDYLTQWEEWRSPFSRDLGRIQSLELSAPERREVEALSVLWRRHLEFSENLEVVDFGELPAGLQGQFFQIRNQIDRLIHVTGEVIAARARASSAAGARVEWVSWGAASIALVLGIVVSLLTFLSISTPLRRLAKGTQEVARGRFYYRLPVLGNDELAGLARDFNEMAGRLDKLDEMKNDFVSHVSHELKSPLASIQETTSLMLEGIPGEINFRQRRLLELNLLSAERLSTMIHNLLELSKMESGSMRYEFQECDLREIANRAVAEIEPLLNDKKLRLVRDFRALPVTVRADPERLLQVLVNLLGNALKFSPPEGQIRLLIGGVEDPLPNLPGPWKARIATFAPSFGIISVQDSGPGVPDRQKERIFQKFHQVKQGGKVVGQGVGLGLAISKTITEAHQGAIWVEDGPNGGAVFHVLLPAVPPAWPSRSLAVERVDAS